MRGCLTAKEKTPIPTVALETKVRDLKVKKKNGATPFIKKNK